MRIECQVIEDGGIVPLWRKDCGKPSFLLRTDMDSLSIQEQSGKPFASSNGNMHACGHGIHTVMLLGTTKLLKGQKSNLHGQVKLIFQADKEIVTGMKTLL